MKTESSVKSNQEISDDLNLKKMLDDVVNTQQTQTVLPDAAENPEESADPLVNEAFEHLKSIFASHFHDAMVEAGDYIITHFYDGDYMAALAKNKTKDQPPNLKALINKIRQAPTATEDGVPSIGWFYNAVNLAAHEEICSQEGLQTFGMLGHSHKLQLLHTPKLKAIQADELEETIKSAFEEKERLAKHANENALSVRDFKKYIKEQYPSDSVDLTDLPPLAELRKRDPKELIRIWERASRKLEELNKLVGKYNKSIGNLETVLSEKVKLSVQKKRTQNRKKIESWEKIKITNDSGVEKEAIAPIIISATRRSDIPAWHSDWFMERLRRGHLLSTQFKWQYISFAKTRVIVFWTKNPQPMLKHLDELDRMGIGYYFTYTLTDYDQDGLETYLPILQDRINTFRELSERIGKEKIVWRFDPLVLTDKIDRDRLIGKVGSVMKNLAGFTEKLVFSFLDPSAHKKVKRSLSNANIAVRDFSAEDKAYVAKHIADMATSHNIQAAACAEAMDLTFFGIAQNKCIDGALMRRLFDQDTVLMSFLDKVSGQKHKGQRKLCGCVQSFDVGINNTCRNGCVYCYANVSQKAVEDNFNRLSRNGEALLIPSVLHK